MRTGGLGLLKMPRESYKDGIRGQEDNNVLFAAKERIGKKCERGDSNPHGITPTTTSR